MSIRFFTSLMRPYWSLDVTYGSVQQEGVRIPL